MPKRSDPTAPDDRIELTQLAVDLAVRAGALALRVAERGLSVSTKSSATDVVTDADRAVEDFLRAEIARARPGDSVLGEERGDDRRRASAARWLIDPIDGTVNFMLGLPIFAVSIAVEVDGETVAACVHNPASGAVFRATLGGGAFLAERRLTGPRSAPLAEAVVATGFGYGPRERARQGVVAGQLLAHVGNIRRLGSAALDLCHLAAGWVDFYYEGGLNEWDVAAGLLVASEAGVRLSGLGGRRAGPAMVAGGHPDHADEFFALLTSLSAGPVTSDEQGIGIS